MRTRTLLPLSVFALLAVLPAARVLAQAPAQPAAPADAATAAAALADKPAAESAAPAAAAAAATAAKSKDASGRDTLSVDFPDEDIRNILRNVADLFELNIIMPETLQGKTTIKLRDVTWRQIFESVLTPVNYSYREEGNIIKIVSNESILQEPTSTDVFIINFARASDILPTVSSLVDAAAGGKIVVDNRSNSLVITERPSRMNRIRPIIEQLDRATDQVMIESKFVEVTGSDVKNIGVNWSSLANYQVSAGGLNGTFARGRDQIGSNGFNSNNTNNRNAVNGTSNINSTANTNSQTSGSTSSNSVTSTNGTPTATSTTGTTGALNNSTTVTGTLGTSATTTDTVDNVFNNLASLVSNDNTARALNAVFSASDFQLVLSALQTLQNTKVVSNPTIVTLNNSQAVINVGEERPIPSYTYNSERGTYEVSGFQYRPIGIILKVTPQVNARGSIKLQIEPEVSQSTRDANFQGASIPIVESRKASTTVSIKDGYTMGIGGLMRSSSNDTNAKVPVLGSIPVLGRMFSHKAKNLESTNLIIFITAKTLSADGAPIEQVFDSDRVRQLQLRREDLPGYRDGSNPFITETAPAAPAAKKK
jgi:type II secretory pathway component GspD/PulD (secretin)